MIAEDQLFEAIEGGDLQGAVCAIENGADVNYEDEDGHTPIMEAAFVGNLDVVKLLLENGADPNRWGQGDNVLSRAATWGHRDVFECLRPIVSEEVRVSVGENDLRLGEKRKERRANTQVESLIEAAAYEPIEKVQVAVQKGVDVNALGSKGQSALHYAAFGGRIEVIELLLNSGAEINLRNDDEGPGKDVGTTPLGLAACSIYAKNRHEVIHVLAAAGADVDARDAKGMTPLMLTCDGAWNFPLSIKALIAVGANLELKNKDGNTALMLALFNKRGEIASILKDAGASDNGMNEVKLHEAAQAGDLIAVEEVLNTGKVDVNNRWRATAMCSAVLGGHTEVVEALLGAGADFWDGEDKTYLDLAANHCHLEIARLLIKVGAPITDELKNLRSSREGMLREVQQRYRGYDTGTDNRPWGELFDLLEEANQTATKWRGKAKKSR